MREDAEAAIARVRHIHSHIGGTVPDGAAYRADDPELLAWVHVAGALMFLDAWRRYAEPRMSRRDQDSYFAQSGEIARMLGADPVPVTRAEAERLIAHFRPQLRADERTRAFRDLVLNARPSSVAELPVQQLLTRAAVDLMPSFALELHGLRRAVVMTPAVRGATRGLARTLRWAFAAEAYR